MIIDRLAEKILILQPKAQFTTENNDYGKIVWLSKDIEMPKEEELEKVVVEEEPEYVRLRRYAYPPIGDQLDALFKAGLFPADMAAKIQAVKDTYEKETN